MQQNQNKMKKNIFITGAAGFIGYHVAYHLASRGESVVGYDNFNDYYSVQLKTDRRQRLNSLGIDVIKGDICEKDKLQQAMKEHKTTHVIHLAAQAGVRYSLLNPQAYVKSNLEGFVNILETCKECEGAKLIYASSSSVYGMNDKVPFAVEDNTDRPVSLYGATKKANELIANAYHHLYKIPAVGLRFFTVYGPWGRPDMAYFSFTKSILEEKPIEVFNFGKMQRDFTYIDDIVDGVVSSLDYSGERKIFNLGNHQPMELGALISSIEDKLGKKAILKHLPMQKGDVLSTFADIQHSAQELQFTPKTSLAIGISKFVDWYREYYQV